MNLLNDYLSIYTFHFILVVLFVLLFVGVGGLIRSLFFGRNKLSIRLVDVCPNLFVGLITSVMFFSLFSTHFTSINFLFIFVALGFLYDRKNSILIEYSFEESESHKYIFLALFFIVFSFLFYSIYEYNSGLFTNYRYDDMFYTTVAYYITHQGVENTLHVSNLVSEEIYLDYYHYFELWLTGLLHTFSNQNNNTVFVLYTSTIINFSALLSFYYLLLTLKIKLSFIKIFILLLIFGFISIITFSFYKGIFGSGLDYGFYSIFLGYSDTTFVKGTVLLLPICMGLHFLRENQLFLASLMISILVVFSVVMLPFAFVSNVLLVVYSFFRDKKQLKKLLFYNTIFYSFFILFYYFYGNLNKTSPVLYFSVYTEIYLRIRVTLSMIVKNFIYFLPYFIIIAIFLKKENIIKEKKIIVLYLILIVATSFMSSFFYKHINYLQIAGIINFTLTKILIVYLVAKISVGLNTMKNSIMISLFFILLYQAYYPTHPFIRAKEVEAKKEFRKQINVFLNKENKEKSYFGVYISPPRLLDSYNIISTYNSPFVFLSGIQSGVSLLSLSHVDIPNNQKDPIDSLNFEIALNNDPFYKFVKKQRQEKKYKSLNQSRYDFILQYRPYFLAVREEKDVPSLFRPILGERIENKPTQTILYRFNYDSK